MKSIAAEDYSKVSGGGALVGRVYQINGPNDIEASIGSSFARSACVSTTNWQQFLDGTIQRGEGALVAIGGLAAGLRSGNFTPANNAAMALGAARFANGVYLQQTATGRACVK